MSFDVTPDPLQTRVRSLADEATEGTGLFVVEVVVRGRPGGRVVEVFADSPTGAGLDELAELSRRLSFLLDTEDPIKGQYRLDVSTPGASRPLLDRRQYGRHAGRDLQVAHVADGEEATASGTLAAVDDDGIDLDLTDGGRLRLSFEAIREARVLLPW